MNQTCPQLFLLTPSFSKIAHLQGSDESPYSQTTYLALSFGEFLSSIPQFSKFFFDQEKFFH